MYGPRLGSAWSERELAAMSQTANELRGSNTYVCQRKEDVGFVIEWLSESEMVLVFEWFNSDRLFRPFRKEERVKPLDPSGIREWICRQTEAACEDHRNRAALYRELWPSMVV